MIQLKSITGTDAEVKALYQLLKKRSHFISHTMLPAYEEHSEFVRNHPYRAWFLIYKDNQAIGSAYVHSNNTIGLNIDDQFIEKATGDVLELITKDYPPLPAIKSERNERYSVNIPISNKQLIKALEAGGHHPIQVTYIIDSKTE